MSEPVIRTEGLVKEFPVASKTLGEPRKVLHAVTNVSLSVPKGGIFGIVGESGCGKSTLGRCLLRLETITKGSVFFQGRDITNLSGKDLLPLRKNMQMIFQAEDRRCPDGGRCGPQDGRSPGPGENS